MIVKKKRRLLEYDGLKGISILAIVLYHLFPRQVPGGFLTVNTFFVLAGYFFTYKVESFEFTPKQREWRKVGGYLKQTLARLFFPLLWMIGSIVIGLLIFSPNALKFLRNDLFSGLFLYNNLYQIAADKSYFVRMTEASPFTHLWYNSLYIQSFIVTIIVVLVMKYFNLRGAIKAIVLGVIAFYSHNLLLWLYVPGQDPSRVYYGLETRISSFILGVMLTYTIPALLNLFYKSKIKKEIYLFIGLLSLTAFVLMPFFVQDQAPDTYYAWMPLYSVISFGIIFSMTVGVPFVRKIFRMPLLAGIGKRSYSYYLWYYPVIVFWMGFSRQMESQMYWLYLAIFVTLFAIGELSYQLIEQKRLFLPFLKDFDWAKDWRSFRRNNRPMWLAFASVLFVALTSMGMVLARNDKPLNQFVLEYQLEKTQPSLFKVANPSERKITEVMSEINNWEDKLATYITRNPRQVEYVDQMQASLRQSLEESSQISALISENQAIFDQIAANNPEIATLVPLDVQLFASQLPVSFFGDSLILLSGPNALNLFLNGTTMGVKSLQIWDAAPVLSDWIATGEVRENLVVNLGTNAGLDDEGMEVFIAAAGDRKIFFVTTNSAVAHKLEVNQIIRDFASRYDNVYELDWYTYAQGHPEFYWEGEDIHHTPEGADHFAAFVAQELYKILR